MFLQILMKCLQHKRMQWFKKKKSGFALQNQTQDNWKRFIIQFISRTTWIIDYWSINSQPGAYSSSISYAGIVYFLNYQSFNCKLSDC